MLKGMELVIRSCSQNCAKEWKSAEVKDELGGASEGERFGIGQRESESCGRVAWRYWLSKD